MLRSVESLENLLRVLRLEENPPVVAGTHANRRPPRTRHGSLADRRALLLDVAKGRRLVIAAQRARPVPVAARCALDMDQGAARLPAVCRAPAALCSA